MVRKGEPVYLNIYDLSDQNSWTLWAGVGVFHSGVEVYGVEYAYGGHEFDSSGVFATTPRNAPGAVTFREQVLMGTCELSPQEVHAMVRKMGQLFKGNRYHLLQQNCNHFSGELVNKLTGRVPPGWINRLARLAVMVHCLLPPTWVPPLKPPTAPPAELQAARPSDGSQGEAAYPASGRPTQQERSSLLHSAAGDRGR